MPAYFIADISIHGPDGYQAYLAGFIDIFDRYSGKLKVVSSAEVDVIEGDWAPKGIALLEFPTLEKAKAWKNNPDYIELAKSRKATAETNLVLVEGL